MKIRTVIPRFTSEYWPGKVFAVEAHVGRMPRRLNSILEDNRTDWDVLTWAKASIRDSFFEFLSEDERWWDEEERPYTQTWFCVVECPEPEINEYGEVSP